MSEDKRKVQPHPSGKPIRRRKWGTETMRRPPTEGPINPRLQRKTFVEAVGFHRYVVNDEED